MLIGDAKIAQPRTAVPHNTSLREDSRLVHQWLGGVLINVGVADLLVTVGLDIRLAMSEFLFCIAHRILRFAVSFFYFAFGLLAHTFQLLFFAIGRLPEFLLRFSGDVLQFA